MKYDTAEKNYLDDEERIADCLNGRFFHGQQVIRPEEILEADSRMVSVSKGGTQSGLHMQDLVRKVVRGVNCVMLGIENQHYCDPAMVLRVLGYTVRRYEQQRDKIRKEHKDAGKLAGDEYISGMSLEDRLHPVLILVIYYGDEEWRGARRLHDLLDWRDIPEEWKGIFADYELQLLDVQREKDLSVYHSDLRILFGFIQNRKDREKLMDFVKKNKKEFSEMKQDLAMLISQFTHSRRIQRYLKKEYGRKGETVNMYSAFDEMIEDYGQECRQEGRQEGREEINKLYARLLDAGRYDDLRRAMKDCEFQQKLLDAYQDGIR